MPTIVYDTSALLAAERNLEALCIWPLLPKRKD